jgi:Lipopolysaccharide kinase (Kdo/WaaP) family
MRNHVLYARSPKWRAVIERADQLLASPDFRPIKTEGKTLAGFINLTQAGEGNGLDSGSAFLKRVEIPSWIRGIYERLRGSSAEHSVAGAAMLETYGLAHPEPLAAMNSYAGGAIRASYLLSAALEHADTLSRFAIGPGGVKRRDVRRRKLISDAVALQVQHLHASGIYTRDLQETNMMVEDRGAEGFKVYFIDLEDFRKVATVGWDRRMLNLVHLDRSVGRFLSRSARLDFLYSYLGWRPDPPDIRKIVADLMAARSRIERRKRRGSVAPEAPPSAVRGVL